MCLECVEKVCVTVLFAVCFSFPSPLPQTALSLLALVDLLFVCVFTVVCLAAVWL
jgi:hypothetical protein